MYRRIATAVVAATTLGIMVATPALAADVTIQGRAVATWTGNPVAGVKVTAVDVLDTGTMIKLSTVGVSDRKGYWHITLPGRFANLDEVGLRFNGAAAGREKGFGGCYRDVVPTWGEACSFGDGVGSVWSVGRFRLDLA